MVAILLSALAMTLIVLGGTATVARAGGGGGCEGGRKELSATNVDIQQYCFTQTVVHVAPGSKVTWTNLDETPHMVTGVGAEWGDYESLPPAKSVTHEFDTAGVYPYSCILHPGMVGAVVVGDSAADVAAALPIASDHGGNSTLVWIVGGALAVVVAAFVTSLIVTRRRTPS